QIDAVAALVDLDQNRECVGSAGLLACGFCCDFCAFLTDLADPRSSDADRGADLSKIACHDVPPKDLFSPGQRCDARRDCTARERLDDGERGMPLCKRREDHAFELLFVFGKNEIAEALAHFPLDWSKLAPHVVHV